MEKGQFKKKQKGVTMSFQDGLFLQNQNKLIIFSFFDKIGLNLGGLDWVIRTLENH